MTAAALTLPQLREVLVDAAGATEDMAATDDYGSRPFEDLGYDSLALMESAAELKRRYGIEIPEEALEHFATPDDMLQYVNSRPSAGKV